MGGRVRVKARDFLFLAEDLALEAMGEARPPERRVMWTVLQLHYGAPWVHFELQPQMSRRLVEVGLHFEGAPEQNEAASRLVAGRPEIAAALGPDWELEEWTQCWRRLHRSFAIESLSRELATEVAEAWAGLVRAAGPLLVESGLARQPEVPREERKVLGKGGLRRLRHRGRRGG
jgi:hypothetical protein